MAHPPCQESLSFHAAVEEGGPDTSSSVPGDKSAKRRRQHAPAPRPPRRFKSLGEHLGQLHAEGETQDLNPRKNDNPCQPQGRPSPGRSHAFTSRAHWANGPLSEESQAPQGVRGPHRLTPRPSTTGPGARFASCLPRSLGFPSEGDAPGLSGDVRRPPPRLRPGSRAGSRSPPLH